MKHNYYLIWLIILSGIILSSCNERSFLDETATTDLTTDVIFADSTYTVGFLSEVYREIGFDTDPGRFSEIFERFGGLQGACDEVECKISAKIKSDMLFATGSVNPVIVSEDAWEKCWQNIRRVNVFLQNVDRSPLSEKLKTTYKAEARFLRAWYYFILVRHYGGVPLIGDVVYGADDKMKTERNTFAECVDYILSECEAVAPDLTVRPAGRDYGRVGSGACMGLKSRVLLYAASPLYNGGAEVSAGYPKELVAYPEYEKERWKAAMDAAMDVISLGAYQLYDVPLTTINDDYPYINGYFWIFQASDRASDGAQKEHLVEQQVPKGLYRERLFCPPSRGGNGGGFAYQDLIDCYPMLDGTPYRYTPEEEQAGQNPWANRDPRLYQSITYDQHLLNEGAMNFRGIVNTYLTEDGRPFDQDAVYTGTPTGYYICKMQHFYAAAGNGFIEPPQSRPQLRYAEILLNYAEAATEWHAPANPPAEVYEALKLIRKRAGIQAGSNDLYGLEDNMTADKMREIIRNERRIELAFEGHRFFDVRRWMIAPQTDSKMMTGMETRLKSGIKVYTRFNVRQHVWRPAMYFWPLPYKEVSKAPDMKQNPFY